MCSMKFHQTTEVISQETEVSHLSFVGHGDRTGVVLSATSVSLEPVTLLDSWRT